jgi:glutaconyl-CoA/methylmalonyl-CoA decarboxylase subunit gamma
MKNNKRQKFRVKGAHEFAFVTNPFSVRKTLKQQVEKVAGNEYHAALNGTTFTGEIVQKKQNNYSVMVNGNIYHFEIVRDESAQRKKKFGIKTSKENIILLKAPMPGKICEIFVSKGTQVKHGEPLLILEAMKMQNQILASSDSVIESIAVKTGEPVFAEQLLITMKQV